MPGLTIATDAHPASAPTAPRPIANPRRASASSRTSPPSSPSRPPVSPITPMLGPTQLPGAGATGPGTSSTTATTTTTTTQSIPDFALGRPTFTHTTQTDQVGVAPPPAQPIDFDSNPDVLALKSAISILQLQRARATADIQSLSRARDAALGNPASFVADLQAGKVRVEGDPLFSGTRAAGPAESVSDSDSDSDSDSSDSSDPEPERQGETPDSIPKPDTATADGDTSMPDAPPKPATTKKPKQKSKQRPSSSPNSTKPPAWQNLPKPQTVVRCPPINWAQYGVVGDSLDKLHAEQLAAPTPGAPAVLGPGGTYEFKAGDRSTGGSGTGTGGGEPARRLVGVAAPYNPLRDKLEKKGKGAKR